MNGIFQIGNKGKNAKRERKGTQNAIRKESPEKVENFITIVCDGNAPYIAAKSLYDYIKVLGHEVQFIDTNTYKRDVRAYNLGKVMIVGHHTLAKTQLHAMGTLAYDSFGMKFGFSHRLCVLSASRSALGDDKSGKQVFSNYYNDRMAFHKVLATSYAIPMQFGHRDQTRKSQYDLLWLEFVTYGLSQFLPKTAAPENIAEEAFQDLMKQMDAEKDMTFSLAHIAQNINEQNDSQGMKTLRKHLGNDIVCTGLWADAKEVCELEESQLLEGELSACTFQIGCYAIRSAQRLYKDTSESPYTEKAPACKEEILSFQESQKHPLAFCMGADNVRLVHELHAKHHRETASAQGWNFICLATSAKHWSWREQIAFIAAIKSDTTVSDEEADLFILNSYTGSSFCVASWYRLDCNGKITTYQEHPLDTDSFEIPWRDPNKKDATVSKE